MSSPRTLVLALCAALVLAASPTAAAHTLQVPPLPDLPVIGGGPQGQHEGGASEARPAFRPEPGGPADRATPPRALVHAAVVSASIDHHGRQLPLVVPDEALPLRFDLGQGLVERFGLAALTAALGQWNAIPGSRWAVAVGTVTSDTVAQDGVSTLFAERDCPAGVAGYAYWQTGSATLDVRYGEGAVFITEADIGICPTVTDAAALRATVAHELGHVLGLDHLCNPGQPCWREGMGPGPHTCRVLYAAASSCRWEVDPVEHDAARHQYPTLRRLSGPSRVETAARVSYAGFAPDVAATVVLARADGTGHGPLAASALAGALAAPLLLGVPDSDSCVSGAAAEELARVAASPAQVVLVGPWPQACEAALAGWNLSVSRLNGADPVALALAVADRLAVLAPGGDAVFVVSDVADGGGHIPDGVAGGAGAGAVDAPLLYTSPDGLNDQVASWLNHRPGIRRAYIMGGEQAVTRQVVTDLEAQGLTVVRVAGATRVDTALALAGRSELFGEPGGVVLAAAGSWADAVSGAALGGRLGLPVLLTPPAGAPSVEAWLAAQRPGVGWLVGGSAAIPYQLQWRYTQQIG